LVAMEYGEYSQSKGWNQNFQEMWESSLNHGPFF
jgi:hypothetical protein